MLTTFEVGPHVGRVCYVTNSGEKCFVTIECPFEKVALRFETNNTLKIGNWVRTSGVLRADPSRRADGSLAEATAYYHEPHDSSNKSEWIFKQLSNGSTTLVAPPQFSSQMHNTMLCLRRHLDSWEKNLELSKWEETADCLKSVLKMVENEIEERKPVPTVAIQLNDL